ncbi:Alpha-N-acetylgalactosaminidase [Liparis tanakae]|uniref:Alpha-N-acetylgalactosaminidase n=1 Tax=Liparis tanakae TaxID=230148 RepID=A0A4Z2IJ51_9TELE|nr:Alpha-N-acetylgalactosaminidase [Liparis tanakae]
MAAPLIMSNDLRNLDNSARFILQNKMAIAINQDPMGIQGRRLLKEKNHIEVYWRPLSHSASALVFLSRRTDMPSRYHTSLAKLKYDAGNYEAYDVFTDSTVKGLNATTEFTLSINPSGVVMWYVYPKQHSKETKTLHHQHKKASQFAFHKAEPAQLTVL